MLSAPPEPAAIPPGPLRNATGRGRPYPDGIVAEVRALVVDAGLSYREAAARSGLREDTVGRWARRFGWRRGELGGANVAPRFFLPGGEGRVAPQARAGVGSAGSGESPPRSAIADSPSPPGREKRRHGRYGPELHEAARVRVEGSRVGMERIAAELGLARATLYGWQKRFGWRRPAPPGKAGPAFYRSRRLGRPYGGDAVGIARDLVLGSKLPPHRIAAQAGVSRATLYRWMERRGWTRPVATGRRPYRPPYGPSVVAAARELYGMTELSTRMIAARVRTTPERVGFWARTNGWTRPRDMADPCDGRGPHGRVRRRRRRLDDAG